MGYGNRQLQANGLAAPDRLPFSIRILVADLLHKIISTERS
ncbi:MAG: hypothetical protein QNJ22_24025 [Desulfosarcinaceae bacterium]|nr:hypothetical protein [Desulfosarcinaceae bacterium]